MVIESGLFVGTVRHRRFTPVPHQFSYPACMVLLDVDRIGELTRMSRLVGHNRWNWASFDDRDHLGDPRAPLRDRLNTDAARAGIQLPDGQILLLTQLRYFGYCFNPVSFYYLFDAGGDLTLVMAEVNNTFGGSQTYWLRPDGGRRAFRATAEKTLYVSPFLPVDLEYRFRLTPPLDRLVAQIDAVRSGTRHFDATLVLERRPWSARELRRQLIRVPAATAQVTARIHWQALRLWWKGVPVVHRRTRTGVAERRAVMER
jgi:DUF1365 family protein